MRETGTSRLAHRESRPGRCPGQYDWARQPGARDIGTPESLNSGPPVNQPCVILACPPYTVALDPVRARRSFHVAQRWCPCSPGRRVGGAQRGRAPARLAKCIAGQQAEAQRRIEEATKPPVNGEPPGT